MRKWALYLTPSFSGFSFSKFYQKWDETHNTHPFHIIISDTNGFQPDGYDKLVKLTRRNLIFYVKTQRLRVAFPWCWNSPFCRGIGQNRNTFLWSTHVQKWNGQLTSRIQQNPRIPRNPGHRQAQTRGRGITSSFSRFGFQQLTPACVQPKPSNEQFWMKSLQVYLFSQK